MFFKFLPALALALCLFSLPARAAESGEMPVMGPPEPASVYDRPYSLWDNNVDKAMLRRNTLLTFGASVVAVGVLYTMPSSVTHWEHGGQKPFDKWWHNVSRPPVWDEDDLFLNYVTHPYAGAVYYMGARSAGVNAGYSFLYSFAMSTFFWEYGLEAFAERPSIQDLIVTPVFGSLLGEGFYRAKRHIVANDYRLYNSRFLGVTAAVLMDPMSEIGGLIWDDDEESRLTVQSYPSFSSQGDFGYQLSFTLSF